MKHNFNMDPALDTPGDSRLNSTKWNQAHALEADENFVSDAQLAALASHVSSSAVITDHAIVRGDGGAKGVQDSIPTIDDAGVITSTSLYGTQGVAFDLGFPDRFDENVGSTSINLYGSTSDFNSTVGSSVRGGNFQLTAGDGAKNYLP